MRLSGRGRTPCRPACSAAPSARRAPAPQAAPARRCRSSAAPTAARRRRPPASSAAKSPPSTPRPTHSARSAIHPCSRSAICACPSASPGGCALTCAQRFQRGSDADTGRYRSTNRSIARHGDRYRASSARRCSAQLGLAPPQRLQQHPVLAAEVVEDVAGAHPDPVGDVLEPDAFGAALGEGVYGGKQHAPSLVGPLLRRDRRPTSRSPHIVRWTICPPTIVRSTCASSSSAGSSANRSAEKTARSAYDPTRRSPRSSSAYTE